MPANDRPAILVFPPLATAALLLTAIVLQWWAPLHLLAPAAPGFRTGLGLILTLAALALALSGARTFRRAGTNVDPRKPALKLVETGPYRICRNPMYTGMVLLQLGLALTFSLDWALFGTLALWALLHFGVVLREEAYLTQKFGAAYLDFMRRTRRWCWPLP